MRNSLKPTLFLNAILAAGFFLLPVEPSYALTSREAAALSLRINRLEAQLRAMTGKMEEQAHSMEQMQMRFERFSQDTEFRFQGINPGKGTRNLGPAKRPVFNPKDDLSDVYRPPVKEAPLDAARASTVRPLGAIPGPALNLDLNPGSGLNPGDGSPASEFGSRGPQESYDHAYGLILRRDYGGAQRAFRDFLDVHGTSALAGNAQYWLGESFYARRQFRPAADAFLVGYTKYATSGKAPGSLLKLGMTLFKLGQKDAGCASLAELSRKFPRASKAIKKRAARERRRAGC